MSVSYWQDAGDVTPRDVDTVVIGAGIIGSYIALQLAERGRPPIVIDGRHAAGGATGRNAGMLLTGLAEPYHVAVELYGRERARTLWGRSCRNQEIMVGLAQRFGIYVERCGSFTLATNQEEEEAITRSATLLKEDGFAGTFYDHDPLKRGFRCALFTPGDGVTHPAQLVAAMLKASGVELIENREIYALLSEDDGVLVRGRGLALRAQRVFLATNAFTAQLEPSFSELITPQRNQVLLTAPNGPVLQYACYANSGYEYFRQLPDGRFLLGGCRNCALEAEQTSADCITPEIQAQLEDRLARYFPDVTAPIERRWAGTMAFTPDGLPLVGRLRRDERIGYAVGFNGHGMGLGVVVADELLELFDGAEPGFFSTTRFPTTP